MISRNLRSIFYLVASPAMWANAKIYKLLFAPRRVDENNPLRLHLGPGQRNYMDGWVNIDANKFTGKCDVWADLRNPLPFFEGTASAVYSHHVIEHLPDMQEHLNEVYRILKPGGIYRCAGPNGDSAVNRLIEEDHDWFYNWPDNFESIGGRFVNFVFCRNEHLTLLTESYLRELGKRAGFSNAKLKLPVKETGHIELFSDCLDKEWETTFEMPHTLVLEFQK